MRTISRSGFATIGQKPFNVINLIQSLSEQTFGRRTREVTRQYQLHTEEAILIGSSHCNGNTIIIQ